MISRNTVIHANCLTALPEIPAESVDFILTDPPYITRYKSRDGRTIPNDDNASWLKPAFAEMYRVLAPDSVLFSARIKERLDSYCPQAFDSKRHQHGNRERLQNAPFVLKVMVSVRICAKCSAECCKMLRFVRSSLRRRSCDVVWNQMLVGSSYQVAPLCARNQHI
jgi:hypothetical protein